MHQSITPSTVHTARRRAVRASIGATAALGLALTPLALFAGAASAAVPEFPNNVVVFPNRDFVSLEGYSEHAGETALVEVTRPGIGVVGSAEGVVSGTDVAFEINHPGGVCWGNGTALNVTPDILAGDIVSVSFPDGSHDETTTSSATVTQNMVQDGTTVTVEGTFDPTIVNPDFLEQRIINPDLVPVVGKRDVRALPGPIVPAARGGYSSGMAFPTPGHFVATYQFDTQAAADTTAAADLGERAMNWQVQDADGNRQGLTIAEFGEVGGPGFGGCPAGPADQSAPAGTASVVRTGATALLKWTPVTAVPTADPVTGYSVEAIGTPNGAGQQTSTGLRVGVNTTQATLSGLDPTASYTFEVRSMAGAKLSIPFRMGATDTTAPTLSLNPQPVAGTVVETNAVNVNSNGQVFFTTDGSPVISGDLPSDTATLLSGNSIPITAAVTLKIAAFDQVGNNVVLEGDYRPTSVALPAAPDRACRHGRSDLDRTHLECPRRRHGDRLPGERVRQQRHQAGHPATGHVGATADDHGPDAGYDLPVLRGGEEPGRYRPGLESTIDEGDHAGDGPHHDHQRQVEGERLQRGRYRRQARRDHPAVPGQRRRHSRRRHSRRHRPGRGGRTARHRRLDDPAPQHRSRATNPGRIIAKSDGGATTGPFTVSNG